MRHSGFILAIIILNGTWASETNDSQELPFSISLTGTAAIRNDNCSEALQEILMDSVPDDTLFRNFKLAVIYYKLKNYSSSLALFRKVIERNPDLVPTVYIYIAEIEHELGRTANSLAAYRTVLRGDIPRRLRTHIFKKLQKILSADTTLDMEEAPWLEEYYRWLPTTEVSPRNIILDSIEMLLDSGNISYADSLLAVTTLSGKNGCQFITFAEKYTEIKRLSIANIFRCGQMAHSCGRLEFALDLYNYIRKKTKVFGKEPTEKEFTRAYAELLFDKNEWHETIRWYKKFIKRFGKDADAYMCIARAYRKINKPNDAAKWYDILMDAYPHHSKTEEILWLRAWQYEDRKQYSRAGTYYSTIYSKSRKGGRVDESYLRHGLCFYREQKYDSAIMILQKLEDNLPQSSFRFAAGFWRAKCYYASGNKEDAVLLFRLLAYKEPFNYYAHRSRQILAELQDTARIGIDTILTEREIVAWLDSLTEQSRNKKTITAKDSISLLCGTFLAVVGDIEKADFFIEPIELGFPGNFTLQYNIINLYTTLAASAQAHRNARRLTWRIPQECYAELPLRIYSLFYPSFYIDFIKIQTQQYNIPPALISGIIRQESIFDPKIVSPVGAIGLMQIMPATGKNIGKKIGTDFTVDSLYNPFFNITFGVYYVNELLQQFNGNYLLALAGYNAGPHNAEKWEKLNHGKEQDLFVEDIGFTETRGYVKRVLANYWTYQILQNYPSFAYGKKTAISNDSPIKSSDSSN